MIARRIAGIALLVITLLFGLIPLIEGPAELPVAQHHLLHAAFVLGAVIGGVFLSEPAAARAAAPFWIAVAFIAPIAMMAVMWPSEFSYLEQHPFGHALEHLSIIAFAFLSAYAGQRFAAGGGWIAGASALGMSVLAAGGFGFAPPSAVAAIAAPNAGTPATPARGELVYKQNCAVCHGAAGAGDSGPALKNERARKDLQATIAWIEKPAPPMPQLYPGVLSAADVAAVAAYVQGL